MSFSSLLSFWLGCTPQSSHFLFSWTKALELTEFMMHEQVCVIRFLLLLAGVGDDHF